MDEKYMIQWLRDCADVSQTNGEKAQFRQVVARLAALTAENERLTTGNEAARRIIRHDADVRTEDDTAIRDACRPHQSAEVVDGEQAMTAGDLVQATVAALVAERDTLTAELAELREDAAEAKQLRDAVRDEAKKALRKALGPELWQKWWGPELEALGGVVYEVWEQRVRAEAERDKLAAELAAVRGELEQSKACTKAWQRDRDECLVALDDIRRRVGPHTPAGMLALSCTFENADAVAAARARLHGDAERTG